MSTWRSWFLVAVACVVPGAAWLGCGDTATSTTVGTQGAVCYANDTCNAGLDCVAGLCVVSADASTGNDSGGLSQVDADSSGSGASNEGGATDGGTADGSVADGGATDSGLAIDSAADSSSCTLPSLHEAGPGPFCPFQKYSDGGVAFGDCDSNEHCCQYQGAVPPPPASTCNASANACVPQTGYVTIDWTCDTNAQCASNSSCCMFGKDAGATSVTIDPNCSSGALLRATNVGGTHCVSGAACGAGEIKLCGGDADCPMGMTCTAFPTSSKELGVCR